MDIFVPLSMDTSTWDTDKKIVFIEDAFWLNLDKQFLESLDYEILEASFVYGKEKDHILDTFYKQLSSAVGVILNEHHHVDFSSKYWEKILCRWGPYLEEFLYYKYCRLELLCKRYSGDTIKMNVVDWQQNPMTFLDCETYRQNNISYASSDNDIFSFKMYSLILKICSNRFKVNYKMIQVPEKKEDQVLYEDIPLSRAGNIKRFVYNKLMQRYEKKIEVLVCTGLSRKTTLRLLVNGRGRIGLPPWRGMRKLPVREVTQPNREFRKLAKGRLADALGEFIKISDWRACIIECLFHELPMCYLENYIGIRKIYNEYFQELPKLKIILSDTGVYFTELLMAFAEQQEVRGIKVTEIQHGGGWGTRQRNIEITSSLVDIFYTWGDWYEESNVLGLEVKNSPSWKLQSYSLSQDRKTRGPFFLFLGTAVLPHQRERESSFIDIYGYLQAQIEFFGKIRKEIIPRIHLRNFPQNYGIDINHIISERYPLLYISATDKIPFPQELNCCEFCILDHVDTLLWEVLYVQKPFFLLLDNTAVSRCFSGCDQRYVDMMREVGLLQEDAERAAEYFNSFVDNIEQWWFEQERQAVVQILRKRYIFKVDDIDKWWYDEIMSYIQ